MAPAAEVRARADRGSPTPGPPTRARDRPRSLRSAAATASGEACGAAATHRVLRPGGAFLVYQFRARARDFLAAHFARIDNAFEWVNVPPCFLFWAWKD